MLEEAGLDVYKKGQFSRISSDRPTTLFAVTPDEQLRIKTGLEEIDRVLGGGIVPGSAVLVGGPPGIGKSTLLLQLSNQLASTGKKILYVSGEESINQIKLRAGRLGVSSPNLYILSETNLNLIIEHIKKLSPRLVIIDSIQVVYKPNLQSVPGSVSQVRESAGELTAFAKSSNIPVFLIGHVTKEGSIAGPRVLEHMVDVVLYFEGEVYHDYRILRAIKSRFGPTNEIAIFEMLENGLQEVASPSEVFLKKRTNGVIGSTVVPVLEGSRSILVELQSLVTSTKFGLPSRRVTGLDYNRVILLLAVLKKRVGLKIGGCDIFVSIAGGIKIVEPAADLGVCVSCTSSFKERPTRAHDVVLGEVGLRGEVRPVTRIIPRITEAEKLGFKRCIIPESNFKRIDFKGKIEIIGVETVEQALEVMFS